MTKISISLDDSSLEYLDKNCNNRSKYINELIKREQHKAFEKKLEADYREQSNDPDWLKEVALWDCTAGDGLDEL